MMLEQRRYERVGFFSPLELVMQPNGPSMPANSFDISLGGVGVAANVMLNRGQIVRICFHLHNGSNGGVEENVLGRVAYCRADEDGNRMGIEFLETLQETSHPVLLRKLDAL